MSVYKLKNSWWVDIGHNGNRIRKRSPLNTRSDAKAYELTLRKKLALGEPLAQPVEAKSPAPIPSFAEFSMNDWMPTYVRVNNKYSEIKQKESTLRKHLIPYFGSMQIDSITSKHLEEFKALKLKEKYSPKSINNYLGIMGKCLRIAKDWLGLSQVPTVLLLKVPPQPYDFLTEEEESSLFGVIKDPFWYCMVLTALHTGLRHGELLGLRWEDINFAQGLLTVQRSIIWGIVGSPKNGKTRKIPLSPSLHIALASQRQASGYVFAQEDGNPLSRQVPIRTLNRYCDRAGLRHIGWHALRHTFATRVACRTPNVRAIQELLGHSNLTTTQRYVHVTSAALREAVDSLSGPTQFIEATTAGRQPITQRPC